MAVDVDKLTEAELVDLNNRIVERLRLLHQVRSHVEMLEFRLGERVAAVPAPRLVDTGSAGVGPEGGSATEEMIAVPGLCVPRSRLLTRHPSAIGAARP